MLFQLTDTDRTRSRAGRAVNRTQDETDAELEYETKRPRRIEMANQGAGQSRIPVSGSTAELESRLDAVKLLKEVEIGLFSVLFTSWEEWELARNTYSAVQLSRSLPTVLHCWK
jgi:hypothetical protein